MRRTMRIAVAATLAMVLLGGCASSWVEGDDPGEKGYDSSNPFSSFDSSDIDQYNADRALSKCEMDTKTIKTAMVAWNTLYLSREPDYPTPWPRNMSDLVEQPTKLLQRDSTMHTIEGDGVEVPTISKLEGECEDEELTQIG